MTYRPITDLWPLTRCKYRNGAKRYGGYPGGFLERARVLVGATMDDPVLHVCGGLARLYPRFRRFVRDLAGYAAQLGYDQPSLCGSGRIRWDHPKLAGPVFTASTPTSRSGLEERTKLRRALRRAGALNA